jgi:dTDP-4-dehydrorhamnose reductase
MLGKWPAGGVQRIYHLTNSGDTTWAGFAEAIFAEADRHGLPSARVVPIATAEYPTPARRPAMSVLSGERLTADFGVSPRPWREALAALFAAPEFRAELAG